MRKFKPYFYFILVILLSGCSNDDSNIEDENPDHYLPSNIRVPDRGVFDEDISITGNNLFRDSLRISFDNHIVSAYQASTDTIKVRVPRNLDRFNPTINIRNVNNDSLLSATEFQLRAPTISHPEKELVKFSELIWIYGENFDTSSNFITATLNDIEVPIYQATHDSIQIMIPNNIGNRIIDLKINAQLQETMINNIMQLKFPEITFAPQSTGIGDHLTLKGDNFNPDLALGSITINNEIEAHIEHTYGSDSLVVKVPYGPYENFEIYHISYETTGMQSEYTYPIEIDSDFILYTKNNPDIISSYIYNYNDKSYAFARNDDDYVDGVPHIFLYELDYTSREWTRIGNVSLLAYSFNEAITDTGEFFVFTTQFYNTENTMYKIDLNSLSIETVSPPPNNDTYRVGPIIFSHNNELFFGKGRQGNGVFDSFYTDLYSYNISSDSWTALPTDTSEFYGGTSYNFMGNKYISTYTVGSFATYDLKLFNPSNNSFSSVTPTSTFQTENVFNFLNKLLRVTIIPSIDQSYFYNYNSQTVLTTLWTQQIEGTSKYFSKDDKVFFFSELFNNIYSPSNGLYLINNRISSQLE
ncbi:Kelch repeat-containing protein [Formosa maritima]|uniref:IPT/TIG domain-containing protein n=1 Tax=Formosa maritima TaxID=2592046 RepID=A0A5D0GBW9_9FLAO|nr:hypothetical protein [Formosa maritima]TYA56364.1 hypothetical protein FVF61_06400 [Formosa maritima]